MPVVPISLAGSRHVMRKGRVTVRPGLVTLTVHPPVETQGIGREGVRELADAIRARVAQSAA